MVLIFVFLRISLLNDLIDTVYCLYIQYFHTKYIKKEFIGSMEGSRVMSL